jgi:hypothetical protein
MPSTRREMLYQIAVGAAGAAAPAAAQSNQSQAGASDHAAHSGAAQARPSGRKVLTQHEFRTIQALSDWIIPPDERSKGGIEAGTAEFVDVIAATDQDLQFAFTGGIAWVDQHMKSTHGKDFVDCTRPQQKEMLDRIAYSGKASPDLAPGVQFFALVRAWTVDAFYSSKAGIDDLGFIGNAALTEFNGCPEEVVKQLLSKSPV